MGITWSRYILDKPADPKEIARVEQIFGIQFPNDYKTCVLENQGKTPEPRRFNVEAKGLESIFHCLLHFDPKNTDYNLLDEYTFYFEGDIPEGVIPFADDPTGNRLCFDFRHAAENPKIVFLDHEAHGEDALCFVANNFTDLLNLLH